MSDVQTEGRQIAATFPLIVVEKEIPGFAFNNLHVNFRQDMAFEVHALVAAVEELPNHE